MANVSPIGNIMTTSLNKEQKKRAAGVMAVFNVIIGSVPAPPIYGLILDRWGEYNKHCAMIAEKIEKESEINNLLEERKIFFDEKQKLEK